VPLTLQTKGEVSQEKAVEMIESTLMLNGYTLLQQAPGTIMVLGPAKFARSQGTPVYYSPAELPKGERVVTYFMSLKNIKAEDAAQLFQAQVLPPNRYTSVIPVTNANAVLITESTSVVRQLVGMQPSFDVKSQAAKSK
jgi:general secretion pathway protein D